MENAHRWILDAVVLFDLLQKKVPNVIWHNLVQSLIIWPCRLFGPFEKKK